jgi:hypothetical protein
MRDTWRGDVEVDMARSEWSRPELIVVSRVGREESVLMACKTADDWVDIGPQDGYSACYVAGYCYEPGCAALVVS